MTPAVASAVTPAVALAATALSIGYGAEPVVEGISLTLKAGASLALVGTNGSGKSTLLKTILGLLDPVAGSIEVLGARPGTRPKAVAYLGQSRPQAGVVPIRAIDVVGMGRFASLGLFGRTTARDRQLVQEAMAHLEIGHLAERPLGALSGGQRQRVFLAQVMAHDADLLVLDEPTTGLDVAGRERYLALVATALSRGKAVVTATHDISEAAGCDQVLLLNRNIVAFGSPSEVLTAPRLLQAFGIVLQGVQHDDHQDLVFGEQPHGHDHHH